MATLTNTTSSAPSTDNVLTGVALMAPFIGVMGLSLHVAREQWLSLILRALLLLFATFCFVTAIRVMPLADALAPR